MKKWSFGMGRLAICLCELVLGILLLINPEGFTKFIIIGAGVLLLASGVISIVNYLRADPRIAAVEQSMTKGLLMALLGVICCFRSQWLISLFSLLAGLYGAAMLVIGLMKVQWACDMRRLHEETWYLTAISAALTFVFSLLILFNPFGAVELLWRVLAVMLIVESLLDAAAIWTARKWLKSFTAKQ